LLSDNQERLIARYRGVYRKIPLIFGGHMSLEELIRQSFIEAEAEGMEWSQYIDLFYTIAADSKAAKEMGKRDVDPEELCS